MTALLDLHLGVLDDLAPFVEVGVDALAELLRRASIEKVIAGARNFSRNAGSAKIFCVSALSFSTISRGVPLGAAKPYQEPAS